jgi:hypothetical protein
MSALTDRLTPDRIRTIARIWWQAQERERREREQAEQVRAAAGKPAGDDAA